MPPVLGGNPTGSISTSSLPGSPSRNLQVVGARIRRARFRSSRIFTGNSAKRGDLNYNFIIRPGRVEVAINVTGQILRDYIVYGVTAVVFRDGPGAKNRFAHARRGRKTVVRVQSPEPRPLRSRQTIDRKSVEKSRTLRRILW